MWHVVRGGMVHHMVHDGITWCITHLVRYMARLRELEVGGSVDVVQRKGQLRWGKASGGVAKGTSLPLLLFFSSSLSIPVSLFSSPPSLSPAMHLSFSLSPCLPITPSHPFPTPHLAHSRLGNRNDLARRTVDEAEAKVGPPVIQQVDLAKGGGGLVRQAVVSRLLGRVLRGVRDHEVETATIGLADARWRSRRMGEG